MSEPEIDYDLIRAYAEGQLDGAEAERVRTIIQKSRAAYDAYVSLKEALFLSQTGWDVGEKDLEGIVGHLDESESDVSVRFAADRITVSQSSMDEPIYRGIHATFPDGWSHTGPVTIARVVEGQTVRIVLTPVPSDREVILDIHGFAGSAQLRHAGEAWDEIHDTTLIHRFTRRLPDCGRFEIIFRDEHNKPFHIGLALESD